MVLGDFAVLVASALVAKLFTDGSLEEAFAAFATDGSIMAAFFNEESEIKERRRRDIES